MNETRPARRWTKRLKNDLLYGLTVAILSMLRRLPARAVVALGSPLGRLAAVLARPERRRALDNLRSVWPAMPARQRRALMRQVFANLGRAAMECIALPRLMAATVRPVRFADGAAEALDAGLARGHGVVFVTAHYGNWELMAAEVARHSGAPVHVLARQSYDPRFTRMIDGFRRAHGVTCIWVERPGHLRRAVRALRAGAVVGVLIDQPVKGGEPIPFLGRAAPTTTAAAWLARVTGAAAVTGFVSQRHGRHEIAVEPVELADLPSDREALAVATRRLVAPVERAIVRDPAQWTWSLDRWRDGQPTS